MGRAARRLGEPVLALAEHGRDRPDPSLYLRGLVLTREQGASASCDHQYLRSVAAQEISDRGRDLRPRGPPTRPPRACPPSGTEPGGQVEQPPPPLPGRADGLL